jgi:uncharacterized protein YcnI
MSIRRLRQVAAGAVVLVGAVVVPSAVAFAHVTVSAPGATRGGGDQEITFRVPVEKDVDTVGLTVAFPTATPIADVLVEPVAGWNHVETSVHLTTPIVTDDGSITEAVSQITWTAQRGHGLAPGEFGAFTVIAGQLPDTASLTFKAIQRYADGSQVDWTQTEAPGSTADLDHPAPVLTLAQGNEAGASTTAKAAVAETVHSGGHSTRATWALGLSVAALLIAVCAALFGLRARAPRRPS